ncbi:hypothetical protein C0Z18_17365 [Trinickia dabaoshanensis]|uniref:TPM domain-containing protein n=1 Tax=Trinickia dabaoshanensis TaxID=564714 RepID=A0A2N7VMI2_9BURK|nr:TPM domain-containing protein [Trinickia dabaoshanensis]PMS18346.1 hypothetical protein C0Z18_17365 [Trinickia dabaoshanensis]
MNARRIVRHLLTTHSTLSRAFDRDTLRSIEAAVVSCNAQHVGEVCFAVEGALHSAALLRDQSPRERGIEVFAQLRVWDTEYNNGVLIYVLLADRAVEIVADRAVHARVGIQEWQAICDAMQAAFGRGAYRDGALNGIRAVGQHLQRHFPVSGPGRDPMPSVHVIS